MTAVIIFAVLSVLLVAGKILRVQIPLLQKLYLPSSIVGGLLGLLLLSFFREYVPNDVVEDMLKGFDKIEAMDEKYVAPESLAREFIGGSTYDNH